MTMEKDKIIQWLDRRRIEVNNNYVNEREKQGAIQQIDLMKTQILIGVFDKKEG